jgi:hypothetical protein
LLFSILVQGDLPSISPAYPHARYGHSTSMLTDNHLLLYGGCLRYEKRNGLIYCVVLPKTRKIFLTKTLKIYLHRLSNIK